MESEEIGTKNRRIIRGIMSEPILHVYWAVHCHTKEPKECPADILLKYAGIYDLNKVPYLVDRPDTFTIPCGCCARFHDYRGHEIVTVKTEKAPHAGWQDVI